MSRFRPRRNQPKAWLGVFGVSALVTVMVAGASPATADVDSLSGNAFALSVDSSLLGALVPPTPEVSGSASEPQDGFSESDTSVGPIDLLGLIDAGVLNASTVGSGLIGENHFAEVVSEASAADVAVGTQITLGAVEADCFAGGPGSGGDVRLVDAFVGTAPLLVGAGKTELNIPGILNITINERTKTESPGSFTQITINALHIELLADPTDLLEEIVDDVPLLEGLLDGVLDGLLGGILGDAPLVGDLLEGDIVDDLGDLLLPGLFDGTPVAEVIVGHVFCRAEGPNVLIPPTTAPPTTAPPTTAPTTTVPGATTTTAAPTTTTAPPAVTTTTVAPTTTTTTAPPAATTTTKPKVLAITGNETRPLTVFAIVSSVLGTLLWFGGTPESAGPGGPRRRRRFSV